MSALAKPISVGALFIRRRSRQVPAFQDTRTSVGLNGSVVMIHYSDYLREQAAKYRALAEAATEPAAKQEFLELAAACEQVANDMDDRRASG